MMSDMVPIGMDIKLQYCSLPILDFILSLFFVCSKKSSGGAQLFDFGKFEPSSVSS